MKSIRIAIGGLLAACALGALAAPEAKTVTGLIETQNLVAAGTATSRSCVQADFEGMAAGSVGVEGTFTGALSLQRTARGSVWETLSASSTFTNAAGTATATIGSGTTGTFTLSGVTGYKAIRVCGLAAMSGSAVVTIHASPSGGGGSSSGGGGAVTVADGADSALGATTDAAATAGSTGTLSAKLRLATSQLDTIATEVAKIDDANTQLPSALGPQTPANSLATFNAAATGAQTSVNDTAADTTCLAANAARKGATVANDSSSTLYLLLANAVSSATAYTVRMAQNDYYEVPYSYTGVIKCIWSADSTGAARVTEITN